MIKITIVGTVGVPASYGGFETLAENIVAIASDKGALLEVSVYCSGSYTGRKTYNGARLRYVNVPANGPLSVVYDVLSLVSAMGKRDDVILLLGVSGALFLPLIRLCSNIKIVTNIDGVEWKREKWGRFASWFLRLSERFAVRFSHEVIADNQGIAEYVESEYGAACRVIAYGGDHAVATEAKPYDDDLPDSYALALCRVEPENNVEMILDGFASKPDSNLVFIGNWESSAFGRQLKSRYKCRKNIVLVDPIYELSVLKTIRSGAFAYVHGHSAGGTNPSLVEMMHFELPIFAFDCSFNRFTTQDEAFYFGNAKELASLLSSLGERETRTCGRNMKAIAAQNYTWDRIGEQYFELLLSD